MKINLANLTFSKVFSTIKSIDLKNRRTQIAIAVAVVVLVGGTYALTRLGGTAETTAEIALRPVQLVDVSTFIRQGEVKTTESGSREIVVRAEVGGKVTRVVQKGARVSLGQIVAELENSSQRAQLLQAEGALDVANAGLSKTKRGTREEQQSILGTNVSSAQSSLLSAKESAMTSLHTAYSTVDDAIHQKSDDMFDNPDSNVPHFSVPTTETQLATLAENTRLSIGAILKRQSAKGVSLSASEDLSAELSRTDSELRTIRSYLDNLIVVVNKAIPTSGTTVTDIATYKADLNTARANINTSITSLTSARETLVTRQAAIEVAQQNLGVGTTVDEADVISASASVKQAQGAYASALASYQKTIIRSPSVGTIIACSPAVGDIINMGADVCRITASGSASGTSFALPLSAVKYTPAGANVFIVGGDGTLQMLPIETGLVSAGSITVAGLIGDERIVADIRGLKEGEKVQVVSQ